MRFMIIVPSGKANEKGVLASASAPMQKYREELLKAGVLLASADLLPTAQGAKVRFADDGPSVTEGPFAEADDTLAGFWLLETKSKAEAIDWVERAPFERGAEVVLRQVFAAPVLRRPGRAR